MIKQKNTPRKGCRSVNDSDQIYIPFGTTCFVIYINIIADFYRGFQREFSTKTFNNPLAVLNKISPPN